MRRRLYTVVLGGVLLALAAGTAGAQNGHDLYQQALRKERAEGDLPAAIALYRQVVATGDRTLAAQALLRIGGSYEKLGRDEARETYQRLVRDYADQAEAARAARARLAALERPAPPVAATSQNAAPAGPPRLTTRLVWEAAEPAIDIQGQPTPDGRHLTFVDWYSGDLALRDLETGQQRRLTGSGYPNYALASAISRDGRQIAFTWAFDDTDFRPELHVIGIDGSGRRVLVQNAAREFTYLIAYDWSPDDSQIFCVVRMADRTYRIISVSVTDGGIRYLKSFGWRSPMRMSLSPDGRYLAYDMRGEGELDRRNLYLLAIDGSGDIPLVEHPASDLHPVWTPDGRNVLFSSDRGGSIDLWAVRVADGRAQGAPRLVKRDMAHNFFMPMGFSRDGMLFYAKDTGGGDLFSAPFDASSGEATGEPRRLVESYLGYNAGPHISRDGRRLVYTTRRRALSSGHAVALVVRDLASGAETLVPRAIANRKDSRPRISPDGQLAVVAGFGNLLLIDLRTAEARPLEPSARGIEGVTMRSFADWTPDGRAVLYSAQRPGTDGREREVILRRDLATGGEEVVIEGIGLGGWTGTWAVSPDGRHFAFAGTDPGGTFRIRVTSVAGGEPRELFSTREHDEGDAHYAGLAWTPDGRYLLFGRAGEWEGNERVEVWRVPADGGPAAATGLFAPSLRHLSVTADGSHLVFAAGPAVYHEVWAMENVLPQLAAER